MFPDFGKSNAKGKRREGSVSNTRRGNEGNSYQGMCRKRGRSAGHRLEEAWFSHLFYRLRHSVGTSYTKDEKEARGAFFSKVEREESRLILGTPNYAKIASFTEGRGQSTYEVSAEIKELNNNTEGIREMM